MPPPSKSLKHYFSLPKNETLEESFRIDLPPASQLDRSVLEALPSPMRQRVLQGYARRGLSVDGKSEETGERDLLQDQGYTRRDLSVDLKSEGTGKRDLLQDQGYAREGLIVDGKSRGASGRDLFQDGTKTAADSVLMDSANHHVVAIEGETTTGEQNAASKDDDEIIIEDEKHYLNCWKDHMSEWYCSFPKGPTEIDVPKIADYLARLARTNLEMVELCLKKFRRLLVLRGADQESDNSWCSCFDRALQGVQESVREEYYIRLIIKPFNC